MRNIYMCTLNKYTINRNIQLNKFFVFEDIDACFKFYYRES